ncbi:MAG: mechanosensitive ion channel family protein [Acutalibacteraceae bacterium]
MSWDFAQMWSNFLNWLADVTPKLLLAIVIFVVGWWTVKLIIMFVKKGLAKMGVEKSVITFLSSFCKYILRIFAFIIALTPFGFHISSLFAALGAAGITLGLGLKESVANIASGIQIVITKPFQVGHYIQLNNVEGTVTRVEIMYSTLMTLDRKEVVMPNSIVTNSILTNYTALGVRRVDFNYTVSYGTDLNLVRTILLEVAKEHEQVLSSPEPVVVVLRQAANGIEISFRVFCVPENYWNVLFSLEERIKQVFELNNIKLPYTQVDIHFKENLKVNQNQTSSEKETASEIKPNNSESENKTTQS